MIKNMFIIIHCRNEHGLKKKRVNQLKRDRENKYRSITVRWLSFFLFGYDNGICDVLEIMTISSSFSWTNDDNNRKEMSIWQTTSERIDYDPKWFNTALRNSSRNDLESIKSNLKVILVHY